jgi:hypothetical protein
MEAIRRSGFLRPRQTELSFEPANTRLPVPISPQTMPSHPIDDLGPMMRTTVWTMTGIAAAFLMTRLYCKFLTHRKVHFDDMLLVASWVRGKMTRLAFSRYANQGVRQLMLMGAAIGVNIETLRGFGQHDYDKTSLNVGDINTIALVGQLSITFTICSSCWSKVSWAITLLRVSDGKLKKFIWFAIVGMVVLFFFPAILYWVQCTPLEKAWRPLTPGTCLDAQYAIVAGIVASGLSPPTPALQPPQLTGCQYSPA